MDAKQENHSTSQSTIPDSEVGDGIPTSRDRESSEVIMDQTSGPALDQKPNSSEYPEELGQPSNAAEQPAEELRAKRERTEEAPENTDGQVKRLKQELQEKDKAYEVVQEQLYTVQQQVIDSIRLDKQMGDGVFQESMDRTFTRLRDLFLDIVMRGELNLKVPRHAGRGGKWEKHLRKYVPSFEECGTNDKVNVCLAVVSAALVMFNKEKWILGYCKEGWIAEARMFWNVLPDQQNPAIRTLSRQWLSITYDLMNKLFKDDMEKAKKKTLKRVVVFAMKVLESVTTLKSSQSFLERLAEAVTPGLERLQMLHFQDWQYDFGMLPARQKRRPVRFDPNMMEGMLNEEYGFVKASVFPRLCRLEEEEGEGVEHITICKAKVDVMEDWDESSDDAASDEDYEECMGSRSTQGVAAADSSR